MRKNLLFLVFIAFTFFSFVKGDIVARPGYRIVNGVEVDVDECSEGIANCPDYYACQNLPGSFKCVAVSK